MKAGDLTLKEQKAVRVVLRMLRLRVGGWAPLSKALHFEADTLEKVASGRRAVGARMAFIVSRFVDVSMDELLAGKYVPEGTCPHCGHPPDFTNDDTVTD
jgi:hypothetical protein